MGNPIKGTNVFGPVVPFNTDDIYASHKATYGQGGWRTAKNLTERNAILFDRREDLMIVAVEDNSLNNSTSGVGFYMLDIHHSASTSTSLMDNHNWVLLNFGYGADGWVFPPPPQSVYAGKRGQRSFDDTYLYICVENGLWKRVAIDWFIDSGTAGLPSGTTGLINFGDVPIWGTNGEWEFDKVVQNVELGGTAGLKITFTNNAFKYLDIGLNDDDIKWVFPPPITSNSTGTQNDLSHDDNFIYLCVETDVWKRINVDYFAFSPSTAGGFTLPVGSIPVWNGADYDTTFAVTKITPHVQSGVYGEIVTYSNGTSSFIPFGTSGSMPISTNLADLDDVNVNVSSSSGVGNFLKWNGTKWVNAVVNTTSATTAGNGLTITSNKIELGGTLSKNTNINLNNFNLTYLNGSNSVLRLNNNGIINYVSIRDTNNILSLNTNSRTLYNNLGNPIVKYSSSTSGLEYFTDLSSNYTSRSLVDKNYVDSKTTPSLIFNQLFTKTLIGDGVNPQSETSLISSSSGNLGSKILLANSLKVGDIIKIKSKGFINVTSTGTFTLNIKLGSTVLSSNGSVIISNPKTNQLFDMDFEFLVKSIGINGNVLGNGKMLISSGSVSNPIMAEFVMTTSSVINTTINQTLDFTISWLAGFSGNINNTITYIKKEKI